MTMKEQEMQAPMATREELAALIERVRAATGPDRELEIALVEFFNGPGEAVLHEVHHIRAYEYLSSIDAALALTERALGGSWFPVLLDAVREFGATVEPQLAMPRYVILALLADLIAQAETP